jgi:Protein of unknown function (DUF2846)
VKLKAILLLSLFSVVPVFATVLPDACGNDKVSFEIQLQKNPAAPAAAEAGKAQVFFIEKSEKPPAIGCLGCGDVARFGVDGAWVGATKDNSYFYISLDPGVHHLCAVRGKEVDAEPLSVEAGKTYYFQVEYKAEGTQYGTPDHPNYQVKKKVQFSMLNEDDGKYRVKVSALSIANPKHP